MTETTTPKCGNCGAPFEDGLASCGFCDVPIQGRASGVRCPSCGELALAGRRDCAHCHASFTKGCVFCGHVAFLTATACPSCNEAFQGSHERKAQRDAAQKQQEQMQVAQQGIAMLGQVAASGAGQSALAGIVGAITGGGAASQGGSGEGVLGQIWDAVIHSNDGSSSGGGSGS